MVICYTAIDNLKIFTDTAKSTFWNLKRFLKIVLIIVNSKFCIAFDGIPDQTPSLSQVKENVLKF